MFTSIATAGQFTALATSGLLMVLVTSRLMADTSSKNACSLSDVLQALTAAGYQAVTEISFNAGEWIVDAMKSGEAVRVRIDPLLMTVRTKYRDQPRPVVPPTAKPIHAIVLSLEQAGYTSIRKVEFEGNRWEIKAQHEVSWRDLLVDTSGAIIADQPERLHYRPEAAIQRNDLPSDGRVALEWIE